MTYNVHRCVGSDGRRSIERVARVIERARPDVLALQEVTRDGEIDQTRILAERLGLHCWSSYTLTSRGRDYGQALLSRFPGRLLRDAELPTPPGAEPRRALLVEIAFPGRRGAVLATHLGLTRRERASQAEAVLGPDWLGPLLPGGTVVLLGDLNCGRREVAYRLLTEALTDAIRVPRPTWPSLLPLFRFDHILVGRALSSDAATTISGVAARLASDHLPVVATVRSSDP